MRSIVAIASCFALFAAGCGARPLRSRGSQGVGAGCNSFGATQAGLTVASFVASVDAFASSAAEIEDSLHSTCQQMGLELGLNPWELDGSTQEICARVSDRLDSELRAARAEPAARMTVEAAPPRCDVRVDAYAECAAACDASYTPGSVEMQCEGGEIVGYCDATCQGSCAVDVQSTCSGRCEGVCDGRCASTGADGSCAGRCDGQCHGRCVVDAQASCQGECCGGCSIAYREPRCTGRVVPPEVHADCRAACDARIAAQAQCTPGTVQIRMTGNPAALSEHGLRARRAIDVGYANVLLARERVRRLESSGREILRLSGELPNAIQTLGVNAGVCMASAATVLSRAMTSVSVSVEVSVSISGSVQSS